MKLPFRSLVAALALVGATLLPAALAAAEKSAATAVKRHPLRGVVTGVLADKSALVVKHEEIPGVMGAMTMMFKVDAATLKAAQEGRALTGLMSRQDGAWVLEEVKFAPEKKK